MKRSHEIRLNPTPDQALSFHKACGVARHAFNWAPSHWKQARAEGRRVKMKELKREYNRIKKDQFPWAYEVTKCAPEQEFANLSQAFTNYFRMKEEGMLPKLKHPRKDGEEGGIDLGIKTLAVTSEGEVFESQKHYRRSLGRIKGLSKGVSRKQEGSQNWWRNVKKLARMQYRVANQRRDSLHKMTTYLAQTYALIGLEDLNVKGMLANHHLAQAVSDAGFFEVKRQLLYKSEQHSGYVQLVDRWYASSKTCHHCGWCKDDLTLADRVWCCEQYCAVNERDENAAKNIRDEALRLVTGVPVVASSERKFARGVGSSGLLATTSETFCDEAGTKVS